jgi:Spy/CpxP family protein refolding chaperone
MKKLPAIVVLAFALALVAGGVIGVLAAPKLHPGLRQPVSQLPPPPPPRGGPGRVPLGKELNLTPTQEEQMKQIWEATRGEMDEHMRRRKGVEQEWEAAVHGMFSEEQKARFDQLRQEYQARLAAVEGEFESIFRRADDKTRQILDETQRKKFEDILVERRSRHGGPGGPGHGPPGPRRGPGPGRGPAPGGPPGLGVPAAGLRIPLHEQGGAPTSRPAPVTRGSMRREER